MKEGWTLQIGNPEDIERERVERLRTMTPQERLDEMMELLALWKGDDARRLERTYRIVSVPPH